MSITKSQRGLFFVFVNKLGREVVYSILEQVTKGITSLRSPRLTAWKMSWVLYELIAQHSTVLEKKENTIKQGDNVIQVISLDEQKAINVLRKILDMKDCEYLALCRRVLNRNAPFSHPDAILMIQELQNLIRLKRNKSQ